MKYARFFMFLTSLSFIFNAAVCQAQEVSEQEAQSIGTSAYLYFYPLITMDITRKQMTNVEPGKIPGFAPMNTYANVPEYPTADMKTVVRPNFDTLYSSAWLDLTKGPVVLSVPDTHERYYLLPLLDMWTDVFASPGWRTTGTQAADFVVVPQGWTGKIPEKLQVITAPTPYVWIIGRIKTDGPKDYDAVHALQAGLKITPLANWPNGGAAVKAAMDPSVDMKTPPKEQVENMSAAQFFAYAAELLKLQPPHITDEPMMALLKRIGFEQGQSFDPSRLSTAIQSGLDKARTSALELMTWKLPTIATVTNGWSMNTDTMGVYGNYYLKRAIVAREGLGANLPEDAIYPLNLFDDQHAPLSGAHTYTLHFDKDNLPPVNAFWSVTLYDADGYQVANSLNRFALSSWMPFAYNADGSLDLIFSHDSPGADRESNWLPAPAGPFNLTMRLYAPKDEVLVGKWNPPTVKRVD